MKVIARNSLPLINHVKIWIVIRCIEDDEDVYQEETVDDVFEYFCIIHLAHFCITKCNDVGCAETGDQQYQGDEQVPVTLFGVLGVDYAEFFIPILGHQFDLFF